MLSLGLCGFSLGLSSAAVNVNACLSLYVRVVINQRLVQGEAPPPSELSQGGPANRQLLSLLKEKVLQQLVSYDSELVLLMT